MTGILQRCASSERTLAWPLRAAMAVIIALPLAVFAAKAAQGIGSGGPDAVFSGRILWRSLALSAAVAITATAAGTCAGLVAGRLPRRMRRRRALPLRAAACRASGRACVPVEKSRHVRRPPRSALRGRRLGGRELCRRGGEPRKRPLDSSRPRGLCRRGGPRPAARDGSAAIPLGLRRRAQDPRSRRCPRRRRIRRRRLSPRLRRLRRPVALAGDDVPRLRAVALQLVLRASERRGREPRPGSGNRRLRRRGLSSGAKRRRAARRRALPGRRTLPVASRRTLASCPRGARDSPQRRPSPRGRMADCLRASCSAAVLARSSATSAGAPALPPSPRPAPRFLPVAPSPLTGLARAAGPRP